MTKRPSIMLVSIALQGCGDIYDPAGNGPGSSTSSSTSASSTSTDSIGNPTTGTTGPSEGLCGDGIIQFGEECDDGNVEHKDACLPTCKDAFCGDLAVRVGFEECDDGNQIDADQCTNACQLPICGDGVVSPGEMCDGSGEAIDCDADCTEATCGDGQINQKAGEDCEDGNVAQVIHARRLVGPQ